MAIFSCTSDATVTTGLQKKDSIWAEKAAPVEVRVNTRRIELLPKLENGRR